MLLIYIFVLVFSFYLLAVICEDFFVSSLDIISSKLKLSSDVAGATLMAVGSSAPELFTALFAVLRPGDHADIGAGTIVGSAIFNILVIIGASSAFRKAKLTWQPVIRDLLFYIVTIILLLASFWDGQIVLAEALTFLGMYVIYIIAVTQWKKILPYSDVDPIELIESETKRNKLAIASKQLLGLIIPDPIKKPKLFLVTFFLSILGLAGLSFLLVEAAVGIGDILHINPTLIALTVLAAGTSIPDLLSSIIVAKQGRGDMAVSNAVGSNIFDILFGLSVPWLIVLTMKGGVIKVGTDNLIGSVFLLFATVVAILFILITRKWTIGKYAGFFLIGLYVLYIIYTAFSLLG
ncbi:calcium/sodium antiporter [Candidatus Woesebacteria bacterium]|nr:calcium/sodium antiporter [Candidatus Woesebacteria bacterium]